MKFTIKFLGCCISLILFFGAKSQTTIHFTVNQPPVPVATFNAQIQADYLSFLFTDSSFTDILSRKWIFGDGDSATGNLVFIVHEYAVPGVYEACLEVTDNNGCTDVYCEEISHFVGIKHSAEDFHQFNVAPNPYREQAVISYFLPHSSDVTVELYDLVGARVSTLVNTWQSSGQHRIPLRVPGKPDKTGVYFLRLTVEGHTYVKKVVELH